MNGNKDMGHANAHDHAADRDAAKLHQRPRQRKGSGEYRRHRKFINHQSGGIVDQALTFQHSDNAPRNVQPGENGSGRHRIRRRHNGTKHKRGRPRHVWHQQLQCRTHSQCGGDHQPD